MIAKDRIANVLTVLFVICLLPLVWIFAPRQHGVKVYDCSLAEISPDYPVEVKNECRKVRSEKIK